MGFFQDLKEDLSQAVNELLPEDETATTDKDAVEDNDVDAALKEVEAALAAEFETQGDIEEDIEDIEEDIKEDTEEPEQQLQEEEQMMDDSSEETVEGDENPELAKAEEPEAEMDTIADKPVKDAAAAQLKGIADIVAKEEPMAPVQETFEEDVEDFEERELQSPEELLSAINEPQTEETELEKEVGKAMADQKIKLEDSQVVDETAIITAGMTITGDIASKGSMEVLGKVTGNIEVLGKLNVSGSIEGDSKAAEIFADSAHVTGKITADGTVKIGQNSVIIGDIAASSAVIAGAVKGDIDVMGPVILDTSAIVMGNIKSKSVQINNGAVIEGMCSQCYAEVNPTSFFDELVSK